MSLNNNTVRDKLSSYDTHLNNDLYNVYSKPVQKKEAPVVNTQDRLESAQIKEEALQRLNKTFMSDKTHNVIVKMAKYIFIAIAWPPYALFFELPQWGFSKMTPIIKKLFSFTTLFVSKQIETLTHFLLPVFSFMQKTALQIAAPFIRFTKTLQQLLHKTGAKTREFVSKSATRLKNALSLKGVAQILSKLTETVRKSGNTLGRALRAPFEKLAALDIKNSILQSTPIQLLQKIPELPTLFLGWAAQLSIVQGTLFKFMQAQNLAEQGTFKFVNLLSSTFVAPLGFLLRSIQIAAGRINSLLKSSLRKGFDFFGRQARNFGEWVAGKFKTVFNVETLKKMFPPFLFSWIPLYIRNAIAQFFRWIIALPLTQSIFTAFANGWESFKNLPGRIKNGIVEKVTDAVAHFKSAKTKFKEGLASGARKTGWFCNRVLYWTLTTIIMTGIIADWGVQLLARISGRIFRKRSM
jgi:hypothetical protein